MSLVLEPMEPDGIASSLDDLLARAVADALRKSGVRFCLIGALPVNHEVEPVVRLDAELAADRLRAR